MKRQGWINILSICIIILSGIASLIGILSSDGNGQYQYESIRGNSITIYGRGIYKHMSAEVAPQGIAQDVITLFLAIPLLLISLLLTSKKSVRGRFLLAGTLGYFLVTYLFYTTMGMYNYLFLVYVGLLACSFFAFLLTLFEFDLSSIKSHFKSNTPVKFTGGFLIFNSIAIAFLWLSIVVSPLLDGSIYPVQLEHYTTLIVQGLDLGLLLPSAFVIGIMLIKEKGFGYLFGPIYFVFLSILMTALVAKLIGMSIVGANVFPAIIIIPLIDIVSIGCTISLIRPIIKLYK